MNFDMLLLLIFLMACITYFTRVLHVFISFESIPSWLKETLHLVPVVIISSVLTSSVFFQFGQFSIIKALGYIAAIAVTSVAFYMFNNSGISVIIGISAYMLIKYLF